MLSIRIVHALAGLLAGAKSAALPEDMSMETSQDQQGSVCTTYGVDFQDGGSYFINTNSNESFTFVSKFEGCQNDTASLQLVDKDTSDQWDCSSVPTVPDNTPELSTCQVLKSRIVSGQYLIIALGNNGNGQPFSYQREFHIDAGPQQTITAYPTRTVTSTPLTTTTSISFINSTYTVPNQSTLTKYSGTHTRTITPSPVRTTETQTITHTFDRWTKSNRITTVTVTPTCRIPLRPRHPDPVCSFRRKDDKPYRHGDRDQEHRWGSPGRDDHKPRRNRPYGKDGNKSPDDPTDEANAPLQKRAPDCRTTTLSGPTSGEPTLTVTAPPSTQTHVVVATTTYSITSPPKTVWGGKAQQTVTLPTSTQTIVRIIYTKQYVDKTYGWTWTKTVYDTPPAEATKCRREGGHFGDRW